MPAENTPTLLVLERPGFPSSELLRQALAESAFRVLRVETVEAAVEWLRVRWGAPSAEDHSEEPTAVLLAPGGEWPLTAARQLRQAAPELPILLLTEPAAEASLRRALMFDPVLAGEWTLIATAEPQRARERIEETVGELLRRRAHRATLAALNARIVDLRPRPLPDRLAEAEYRLSALLASVDDAVFLTDRDGRILSWNHAAERLFHLPAEAVVGRPLDELVPPTRLERAALLWERVRAAARAKAEPLVLEFRWPPEEIDRNDDEPSPPRELRLKLAPIRDPEGAFGGVLGIAEDVTEARRTERFQRAQHAITHILAQAPAPGAALPDVLRILTDSLGWDRAEFWEAETGALHCTAIWPPAAPESAAETPTAELEAATRACLFHPGEGLPGHVWRSDRPEWMTDVRRDPGFRRQAAADAAGLRAACAVPVRTGEERVGVLVLLCRSAAPPDAPLLEFLTAVGQQLALFLVRKRAEASLRRQFEFIRAIAASLGEGLYAVDREGRLTFVNPAAEHLLGWSESELLGRSVHAMIHYRRPDGSVYPEQEYVLLEVLRTGRVLHQHEDAFIRRDGQVIPVLCSSAPIWADGEIAGAVLSFQDISERVRLETALRQRAEELAEAAQAKDLFLAMLAHELRNPLAPIQHALEVMQQASAEPTTFQRMREVIERNLQHLVRMVDDLLDVSRLTRGQIELRRERLDLRAVIADAVEISRPAIEGRGHRFLLRLPERPIPVDADPTRLGQVVANLLNNAAKYTEPGGRIELSVEPEAGPPGDAPDCRPGALIRVRDTGIGIPPAMLPRIFDLFTQLNPTLDRAHGGLGLGLTLVKMLTEMHGGHVEAASEGPGRGSEFRVWLPLADPERAGGPSDDAGAGAAAGPPAAASRRVLVVDDNLDAAETLADLLTLWGHEVRLAGDGEAALRAAEAFHPDLVLLDIGLPKLDGYEVARRLRARPEFRGLRLVALTGYGQEEDRRRSREAGFDEHLVKPVSIDALQRLLGDPA